MWKRLSCLWSITTTILKTVPFFPSKIYCGYDPSSCFYYYSFFFRVVESIRGGFACGSTCCSAGPRAPASCPVSAQQNRRARAAGWTTATPGAPTRVLQSPPARPHVQQHARVPTHEPHFYHTRRWDLGPQFQWFSELFLASTYQENLLISAFIFVLFCAEISAPSPSVQLPQKPMEVPVAMNNPLPFSSSIMAPIGRPIAVPHDTDEDEGLKHFEQVS